jgi:hypothetical protein
MTGLHPDVVGQLETLVLDPRRPVIVTDADEVLFSFMADFETWLGTQGFRFVWGSFALSGNVREMATGRTVEPSEMPVLLAGYFRDRTELVPVVAGAPAALSRLSARAQIVVLSNLPLENRDARARALAKAGMDYPLVANIGSNHIVSVGKSVPDSLRLHFVADPRLAKLIGQAKDSHHRVDEWDKALAVIEAALDGKAAAP